MKNIMKLTTFVLVSMLLFTGCKSTKIYNVPTQKVQAQKSSEHMYRIIREAGQSLGWNIKKVKPGVLEGKLALRSHLAVVRINYNHTSYNIKYVRSSNLKYNASKGTIHKNYNGWIQNLQQAIDARL